MANFYCMTCHNLTHPMPLSSTLVAFWVVLFNLLALCLVLFICKGRPLLVSLAFNEVTYDVTFSTFPSNLFNLVSCWNNQNVRFSKVLEASEMLSHVDMTLSYLVGKLLMITILAMMALIVKVLYHLLAN